MHWTDEAIILSSRKHGETSAVARMFSRNHGIFAGIVRGASSRANRGVYQSGNIVSVTWQARLSEHLGTFKAESTEAIAAYCLDDALKTAALSSTCTLVQSALAERHPYPKLYAALHAFLQLLKNGEDWQETYVRFELDLLAESGFGLDLSQCAATGAQNDLIYVSPKSGRAVSHGAGAPYEEKMLPLPGFLLSLPPLGRGNNTKEILAGLRLCGYFLDRWLLEPHGKKLPAARQRLIDRIEKNDGKS